MVNHRHLLIGILAVGLWSGAAYAANFSGPGIFMSSNACSDVTSPVTGKTICWDTTNKRWNVWNGTAFQGIQGTWLEGNSSAGLNGSQTNYLSMQGAGSFSNETTNVLSVAPIPGRVCNLTCDVLVSPAAGKSWTFVLQDGSLPTPLTPTSLTCTVSSTSNNTCSDFTQTDCATLTAGQVFDVKVTGTGTPAGSFVFCSATAN